MWDNSNLKSDDVGGLIKYQECMQNLIQENSPTTSKISSDNSILPKELRKFERCRLDSFKLWPEHGMDKKRLAKAGFFTNGNGDEVQCFSCGGSLSGWKYDDVAIVRHKSSFPNCDFITGKSDNVPLNPVSTTLIAKSNQLKQPADKSTIVNTIKSLYREHSENDNHQRNESVRGMAPLIQGVKFSPRKNDIVDGPFEKKLPNSDFRAQVSFEKYKSEEERLKSYKYGWPSIFISPKDLARAGFFFTLSQDKVQCAFCYGIVGHWDRGDDPLKEHAQHFPTCPFLLGYDVGNFSSSKAINTAHDQCRGQDVVGNFRSLVDTLQFSESDRKQMSDAHMKNNFDELGIVNLQEKPRFPAQAIIDARLRSFRNSDHPWPADSPVSIEDLAHAGFFYTGVGDSTKCFYCDGGLTNWVKGDDPWTEHARWFPKCNYVKLNKGDTFIHEVREKFPPVLQKPITGPLNERAELQLKIEELMNSSIVLEVLRLGMLESNVRNALQEKIFSSGTGFSTSAELFNAIQNRVYNNDTCSPQAETVQAGAASSPSSSSSSTKSYQEVEPQIKVPIEAMTLEEEIRKLKEQKFCKICMDHEIGVVFLPCGHLVSCTQCAPALTDCPVCRKNIKGTVRTFLS